jgi:dihydrofolate reductase
MVSDRKVVLYIAMSLDGYIAGPGGDMSFLSVVEEAGQDYGYGDFVETIDTVIMGRKTYDWVMTQVSEFPHASRETFIVTKTPQASMGNINFYNGSLKSLITQLKGLAGKDIFVDGGAEVVNELLKNELIDEFIISVIPVLLGDGLRLFHTGIPRQNLLLKTTSRYEKGLVQLHYVRRNKPA